MTTTRGSVVLDDVDKLELLQSAIVTQGIDAAAAGERLRELMENYTTNLPVEARGN